MILIFLVMSINIGGSRSKVRAFEVIKLLSIMIVKGFWIFDFML